MTTLPFARKDSAMAPFRCRPTLCTLETRATPAGITFTDGHLVVAGTPAADTIRVYFYGADATRVAVVRQTGTEIESRVGVARKVRQRAESDDCCATAVQGSAAAATIMLTDATIRVSIRV